MKILLLRQHNPFVETGASANRFSGLINGLRSLGHTVNVAVTGGVLKPNEENDCDSDIYYLSKANRYSYWRGRMNLYLFENVHNCIANLRFGKLDVSQYDIVWLTNNNQVLSLFLRNKHRIKCKTFIELNEFNDIYKDAGHTGNVLQIIKGRSSNNCFTAAVDKIDLFGVMTNTLLQYYKDLAKPEAKFMHLPMTVDFNRFKDIQDTNKYSKPYIAFTGTMNNAKDGVDLLIKSFANISDKYPTLHLYLAGFWHYDVPSQDKLINQYGLCNRIHRVGVLNRDEIPTFICNASVLALSRPDSHQAQGGFPTKLGEYLATGNPVCVTKVGEIPEYLEDNVSAFMATPGDVDSFADALDRALSIPVNAKRVGLSGRKVAEENFDAKLQAKRLADFLETN